MINSFRSYMADYLGTAGEGATPFGALLYFTLDL